MAKNQPKVFKSIFLKEEYRPAPSTDTTANTAGVDVGLSSAVPVSRAVPFRNLSAAKRSALVKLKMEALNVQL